MPVVYQPKTIETCGLLLKFIIVVCVLFCVSADLCGTLALDYLLLVFSLRIRLVPIPANVNEKGDMMRRGQSLVGARPLSCLRGWGRFWRENNLHAGCCILKFDCSPVPYVH